MALDLLQVKAEDIFNNDERGPEVTDALIRALDFNETELLLTWAREVAKDRPLSFEEHRLRRLVFAQHCLLFTRREQVREHTRRTNSERTAAGRGLVCQCATPKIERRGSADAEERAVRVHCLSCGEGTG